MKKNILFASAVLALSLVGGTAQAFAAEDGGTMPTNGTVNFVAGQDPTDPTDPTEPGNPIQPIDPPTPVGGALSIDYASNFKFGEQKISTDDETYYAALDQFKGSDGETFGDSNYVQVTDKRGTLAGWTLTVGQLDQFKTADGEALNGAQLKINTASAVAAVDDNSMDGYKPGTVASSITLTPGDGTTPGTSDAITAEKGKGAGTWVYRFGDTADAGKTAVQLMVPGKSVKLAKEYKTTLNWTLASIPENGSEN